MASMDANEKEFERLVDEFMENGFSLQEAIDEAKRVLEEKSVRRKAPSIKMAEYEPGDYDPLIVDEYEKYKYDAEEQGQPVMSIDDFLKMARSQAMGGGIMRTNFNAGSAEIYEPERRERQAEIREEKATDIPSRRKARDLDLDIEKIKQLIKQSKNKKNSGIGSL